MNFKFLIVLLITIIQLSIYVNGEAEIRWNNCYTDNCSNDPSRDLCLSKLFEDDSKYSYINIPDFPNNITILNKLYTFTYFPNEEMIQIIGGYNISSSSNFTYPIKTEETNLYEDEPCIIVDQTDCYLAVMCGIGNTNRNKRLTIALGVLVPILALAIIIGIVLIYKKYKQRHQYQYQHLYMPANTSDFEINY